MPFEPKMKSTISLAAPIIAHFYKKNKAKNYKI